MFLYPSDRIVPSAFIRFAPCAFLLLVLIGGCNGQPPPIDPSVHAQEIKEWQQSRLSRLTAEDGWLTLIGLAWLQEGENNCGSAADNLIPLPADRAPDIIGTFLRDGEQVRFETKSGVEVFANDTIVTSLTLRNDHHEEGPTILRYGSLRLYVIKRGDQLGIRVKDSQSKTRLNFTGLQYFPIDTKWRVEAHFDRFESPKIAQIPSLAGPPQTFSFPGVLSFKIDGKDLQLLASVEEGMEGSLFLMFGDETNGLETYGAGRQLYTSLPDEAGMVIIDFNRAYNWPCVFTEFATCPLPPPENMLPIRVEAGEQVPKDHAE